MNSVFKPFFGVFIVLLFTYFAIKPILFSGFFPVHDDTQPSRVYEMAQSLKSGQFPVRWVKNLGYGYGYPLFNFYAPLPYYLGAFFNLLGLSAIDSAKLMYISGILLAAITMYYLGMEVSGAVGGIVASELYTFAPYHAVDIYIRGAVGEYFAMAFLPLLTLGIILIFKKYYKKGIIFCSLGLAGVLLSHNIIGMLTIFLLGFLLMTLILFFYLFKNIEQKSSFYRLLFGILLGICLSSFFILPAFFEKKYTNADLLTQGGSDYRYHFIYLDQLWNSAWGYGGSAGRESGISFKIGKVHILAGLISVVVFIYFRIKKKILPLQRPVMIYLLVFFLLSVFFMIDQSEFLWEIIPGFPYIQFPWRFLTFTVFFISVISSYFFIFFKKRIGWIIASIYIFLVLFFNIKYFQPKEILPLKDSDYINEYNLKTKISRISDEYMPPDFKTDVTAEKGINGDNQIKLINYYELPTKKKYKINVLSDIQIITNIAWFPDWKVIIDHNLTESINKNGRLSFNIEKGEHLVAINLYDTPIRVIANTISLLSLILLVYLSFNKKSALWQSKRK